MKETSKILVAALLLVGFSYTSVIAQETSTRRFGVKGGVNFSNLYNKDSESNKMRTGFNLGVFAKLPVTSMVAIQPELYYTTKGSEVTYNNAFVDGTASFDVNYLELPLLAVINITKNFNFHVGPYAALMITGKTKNESNVNLFNFEENIDVDDFNRLDAGIVAGIGIDFGAVGLSARYNYGLTKVGKERTYVGTAYTFPDATNGVLSINASVSFN